MPVLDFQHLKQKLALAFPDDPVLGCSESLCRPPMPFVVGAPGSGAKRLGLMLDRHPELALAPETGLLPAIVARPASAGPLSPLELLRLVTRLPRWNELAVDAADFQAALTALHPYSVPDGVRALFRLYGNRFGKGRAGDLLVGGVGRLKEIAEILPEARFVHVAPDARVSEQQGMHLTIDGRRLLHDPEPVLREVCVFLDVPFDPCMLLDAETD